MLLMEQVEPSNLFLATLSCDDVIKGLSTLDVAFKKEVAKFDLKVDLWCWKLVGFLLGGLPASKGDLFGGCGCGGGAGVDREEDRDEDPFMDSYEQYCSRHEGCFFIVDGV